VLAGLQIWLDRVIRDVSAKVIDLRGELLAASLQ
jgi:hypothetical protein